MTLRVQVVLILWFWVPIRAPKSFILSTWTLRVRAFGELLLEPNIPGFLVLCI